MQKPFSARLTSESQRTPVNHEREIAIGYCNGTRDLSKVIIKKDDSKMCCKNQVNNVSNNISMRYHD